VLSSTAQTPVVTTTISVQNGATGPRGPAGPTGPTGAAGPAGATECPAGSEFGKLIINHPGGQVAIYTCIVK